MFNNKQKIILQHDERDCGAACLAMIAAHYGLRMPLSKIRELTKTDRAGTNLYGLVDGANKIGLHAEAMSGTFEELLPAIQSGEIALPFVAHIVSDAAMLHFVVVCQVSKERIEIIDPGKGKMCISLADFPNRWTGYIVKFEKTADFKTGNTVRGSFTKFFALLKGQYGKIAAIMALSFILAAIGIAGSFVFQVVIDNYSSAVAVEEPNLEGHDHSAHELEQNQEENDFLLQLDKQLEDSSIEHLLTCVSDNVESFQLIFICLIVLYLFQGMIFYARGMLIARMARKIDIGLTLAYYNHIIDLPMSSVAVRKTGEYLSRFSDTATIRNAISTATITLLMDSIMAIACAVILYLENRTMFWISLFMILVYTGTIVLYNKPIESSNRTVMENNAALQSYLKESIDGIETVKSAGAERQVKAKTDETFSQFINSIFHNELLSLSQNTIVISVELIGTVCIIWAGFRAVTAQELTIGALITFYALLAYFTEPIKNLVALQPTMKSALVAADRLNDILEQSREVFQENDAETLPQVHTWSLNHVDFRYGNHELTLQDVSIQIQKGQRIALVGESGSGKTTISKLLLRFYEPETGTVLINGNDIKNYGLSALRSSIAYVNQETFLFSDTIRNNLRLGNKQASDADIVSACKVSHIHAFIESLPLQYNTPLDENGANLSGGQRQRLSIARALLKNPQLLILDEATSNLDAVTESAIKDTVFHFQKDLTCLIIAHRLSTIRDCDCIYVMQQGRICEAGTHDELLSKNGVYAGMWKQYAD